jgi:hypothetical protein
MKVDVRNNRDFWGGVMFFAVGAVAIVAAWDYPFGSTLRMGPGYFPVILGAIMMAFGLIIMFQGLRNNEKIQGNWSLRALIILPISLVVYGILMEVAGFIPALIALIFISAVSGEEFKFKEVLLLTVILLVIAWSIFIWGLSLPYPMFIKFW